MSILPAPPCLPGCTVDHGESSDWGGPYCAAPAGSVLLSHGDAVTVDIHRDIRDGGRLHLLGVWLDVPDRVITLRAAREVAFLLLGAADHAERSN